MRRNLLLAFIATSMATSSFAMKSANFLEIGITKIDYVRPSSDTQQAGTLAFTDAKMSRAEMAFNITNKDNTFDAKLKYRKDYVGFQSEYMSLDFNMGKDSGFNEITKMSSKKTFSVMNPTFFTFSGDSFSFNKKDMGIALNNFFVFCTANDEEIDMASADGIENGCMTEMSLTSNTGELAQLTYTSQYEDGDKMDFVADLGEVQIIDSRVVHFVAKKVNMNVSSYDVNTSEITGVCLKDENDKVFDSEKFQKECESTLEVKAPKVVMENEKENTKFFMKIDFLKVAEERLLLSSPTIQFVDLESSVTTQGLTTDCVKSEGIEISDLHGIIGECLRRGDIKIGEIYTNDKETPWNNYSKILKSEYDPTLGLEKKNLTSSDVSIKIVNNKLELRASVYKRMLGLVPMKFNVNLTGLVTQNVENEQLIIDIEYIEVPIGWVKLKWKNFFMKLVKKSLVGENIDVVENKITISL